MEARGRRVEREGVGRRRGAPVRWVFFAVVFLALCLAGRPYIYSDGVAYYAISESLARDGDFDLANQRYLNAREWRAVVDFRPFGGRFAAIYSGGIGVMNFPFLWPTIHLHEGLGFLRGLDALGRSLCGVPLAYSLAILAASFTYLCLGGLMTLAVVGRWVGAWSAAGATLAIMCSLPVILFGVWEPSYCHIADAFLMALALWQTVALSEGGRWTNLRLVVVAAALGLATFVRVLNLALFLPWGVYLVWHFRSRGEGWGRVLLRAAVFASGALPFALLLLHYNAISYGHPLRTAYHLQIGYLATHSSFGRGLLRWGRNVIYRLVHIRYGAVWWSPVLVAGVVGLVLSGPSRGLRALQGLCLGAFLAFVMVMGFWNVQGNRGHGAGPRFFIEAYPFLAVGVGNLLRCSRSRWLVPALLVLATIYSLVFQAARISWGAFSRVNALLVRKFPGPAPELPRPPGSLWREVSRPAVRRLRGEWMMYTPFELLRAVCDDSVVPKGHSTRGLSLVRRVWLGTEPSLRTLLVSWLSDRMPVVIAALDPQPRGEGLLVLECRLDRPLRRGQQLALDIFAYDPVRRRRVGRWGRFVTAPLADSSAGCVNRLTLFIDFTTGVVQVEALGRGVPLPGYRLSRNHREVLAGATWLQFSALLRPEVPLTRPFRVEIPNPWYRGSPALCGESDSRMESSTP